MPTNSPLVVLYDKFGHPIGVTYDGAVYRLQVDTTIAPGQAIQLTDGYSIVGITDVVGTKALKVDVVKTVASGSAGSGGTSSNFGDPSPTAGTAAGFTDGYFMQAAKVFDLDSGSGKDYVVGVSLRSSASGGSLDFGTPSNPIRIDPIGSTTQPVSIITLPLPTGASTEATLALIKAKTDNLDVALSTRAVTGLTDTQLRANPVPISGNITVNLGLTDTQLRATPVPVSGTFFQATQPVSGTFFQATQPVSAVSLPLPNGAATAARQDTVISNLQTLNSLVPSQYDYVSLGYTGADLTTVVYKVGGSSGTTVSTLSLTYSSGTLMSVTRS